MTQTFTYGGVDLGNAAVRLGKISGFTSSAEQGTTATNGSLPVDDPGGSRNLVGLKVVQVTEAACATPTTWYGYAANRTIERGQDGATDSLRTAADRRWGPMLVDVNAIFGFEVIHGSSGNRPAETDFARIAWLLASGYLAVFDLGLVSSTGPVTLSAADYRGQTPANVMDDCSQLSARGYHAYWDDSASKIGLFYQKPRYTGYRSTLLLTNVLADVDGSTTFAATASLDRDPQEVRSGVYVVYSGGTYFATRSSTASTFGVRHTVVQMPNITTLTHAAAFAERYLDDHDSEVDRLTVTAQLPAAKVNLLLAGHDVQVRFSELPSWGQGGSSYTYVRVAQRTAAQDEQSDQFYNMTLELQDGRMTGGIGSGALGSPDNKRVWPSDLGIITTPVAATYAGKHVAVLASTFLDSWVDTGTTYGDGQEFLLGVFAAGGVAAGNPITVSFTLTDANPTPTAGAIWAAQIRFGTAGADVQALKSPSASAWVSFAAVDVRSTLLWLKLRVSNSLHTVDAKCWVDGTPEPAYQATVTDVSLSPPGPRWVTIRTSLSAGATAVTTEYRHFEAVGFTAETFHRLESGIWGPSELATTPTWQISPNPDVRYQVGPATGIPGYTVGQPVPRSPLAFGDGTTTAFTTPIPYSPGSLVIDVDGLPQDAIETSSTGVSLTFAPLTGETVFGSWIAA